MSTAVSSPAILENALEDRPASGTPSSPSAAYKRSRRVKTWELVRTYAASAIIVLWCLAPFYWMMATAFRPSDATFERTLWPTNPTLQNFETAFSTEMGNHFARALGNSVLIASASTLIALVVGVFAAYALARLDFKFKGLVMGFVLGASMFPGVALITPLFKLFTDIGWMGTYQALILPSVSFVLPLTVYTLTSFFRELPWELEEAARIDGCTPAEAFVKIMLPLAAPAVFTTAILAFIAAWNEFLIASVLSNDTTQTVTVAIAKFAGAEPHQEPYTAVMAAGTIVTIPLVILVLVFQRRIVSGLTTGAVK